MAKDLGNTESNDGWTYRGQGIIQLTGKAAYIYANRYTQEEGFDIVNNPDIVSKNLMIGVLTAMAFWKWKKIYNIANDKSKKVNRDVCEFVGNEVFKKVKDVSNSTNYIEKQKAFDQETSKLFRIDESQYGEITDIITYYSYANNKGTIVRQIAKVNKHEGYYKFIYHDKDEKEHNIRIYPWVESVTLEYKGTTSTKPSSGNGYTLYHTYRNVVAIDGDKIYAKYDDNGELDHYIVTNKSREIASKKYNAVKSSNGKNKKTTLVNFETVKYEAEGILIDYVVDTSQTERIYSDPGVLAVLIGVMAEVNKPYRGTGNTEKAGTGYPSNTHVNGFGLDFSYQHNATEAKIIELMIAYGCSRYYFGTTPDKSYPTHNGKGQGRSDHNSHLHIGPFNKMRVIEKKDE